MAEPMWSTMAQSLFGGYAPHGYCLLWRPELVWTHVASDALIALAYFSIPLALIRLVNRRRDVAFGWMIWLFAVFILACGTTHVMGIWNLWHGDYALEAFIKAITAAASVPTAILLWRLIPQAIAIPSPSQLQNANDQLRASIAERDEALRQLQAEIGFRERAEAALVQAQKLDAIGQLTGGIAHDFNNLLQAVGGNLDLIRAQPGDTDRVSRWADNASKGIARGTKLTGQLLAFSRTQRLELRPLDLNALIRGMLDLVASSVGPRVTCHLDLQDGGSSIRGDATQLELAVLNLAINARDAMPDGGKLTISTRVVTLDEDEIDLPPGNYIELAIADNGTGMPREVMERAMEPFFTTKGVGAGTGLGLSMAFGVAAQSGGTLRLDSTVGEGTTVRFILPFTSAQEEAGGGGHAIPRAPGDGLADLRIAVVDDDADVRHFVTDCLTGQGASCSPFDNGAAFLQAFEPGDYDLVLLDFAMPGISGAEVAQQLKARDPAASVIIMTGYADSAALDTILGEVRVMRKPFGADTLIDAARLPQH